MSKDKRIKKIINKLNAWADSSVSNFSYYEYYDEEHNLRFEFSNDYITFVYFPTVSILDNFWFGARHHMPIGLVKDILCFLEKFGHFLPNKKYDKPIKLSYACKGDLING
jgi:hypothetical protein